MKYFFYWGCSLDGGSGANFKVSIESICRHIGIEIVEIDDWNCCGASISYAGANDLEIKVLNARNFALAEAKGSYDIIAPCSSCYIQMNKFNYEYNNDEALKSNINEILSEGDLKYTGRLRVRHIQDLLFNDVGINKIKEKVRKPLHGLKVAGYVGCQTVRPYGEYDSVEKPAVQDYILEALGAEAVLFPKKINCCGSGIFLPEMDLCLGLAKDILDDAINNGAELISTVCPMCAMNLEMYQGKINEKYNTKYDIPIVYLTQLIAIAFGMDFKKDAALNYNFIPPEGILLNAIGH